MKTLRTSLFFSFCVRRVYCRNPPVIFQMHCNVISPAGRAPPEGGKLRHTNTHKHGHTVQTQCPWPQTFNNTAWYSSEVVTPFKVWNSVSTRSLHLPYIVFLLSVGNATCRKISKITMCLCALSTLLNWCDCSDQDENVLLTRLQWEDFQNKSSPQWTERFLQSKMWNPINWQWKMFSVVFVPSTPPTQQFRKTILSLACITCSNKIWYGLELICDSVKSYTICHANHIWSSSSINNSPLRLIRIFKLSIYSHPSSCSPTLRGALWTSLQQHPGDRCRRRKHFAVSAWKNTTTVWFYVVQLFMQTAEIR